MSYIISINYIKMMMYHCFVEGEIMRESMFLSRLRKMAENLGGYKGIRDSLGSF